MKRDMDLVRMILMELESKANDNAEPMAFEDFNDKVVDAHLSMMSHAGLISVSIAFDEEGNLDSILAKGLTWTGHEFLDAARSNLIWNAVNRTIAKSLKSTSFEVLEASLNLAAAASISGSLAQLGLAKRTSARKAA